MVFLLLLVVAAVCFSTCSCTIAAAPKGGAAVVTTTTSINGDVSKVSSQQKRDEQATSGEPLVGIVAYKTTDIIEFKKKNVSVNGVFVTLDKNNKTALTYYGLMLSGAVARSASATAVHPLNVIKTMLQTKEGKVPAFKWSVLSRGAGSQFIMSIPHGAINFAVTEKTKLQLARLATNSSLSRTVPKKFLNPLLDFVSSAVSTFICSIVSTPQMVLTDRIMAGVYPHFFFAVDAIAKKEGLRGFYRGWAPALTQKIPSYALTWMFFQQLKLLWLAFMGRSGTTLENTLIGSFAAAGACCVMIPIDTVKTRIVMQAPGVDIYNGMFDCLSQIIKHEGVWALYRALPPRLLSVVPMIGIQFGIYELMKRLLMGDPPPILLKMHEQHMQRVARAREIIENSNLYIQEQVRLAREKIERDVRQAQEVLESNKEYLREQVKSFAAPRQP